MPWKSQGGGPWGGGGGGPWGSGGGGGGPMGGGGPTPPDIEELLRKSQERVKKFMPGKIGGGRGLIIGGLLIAGLWLASGFYKVNPGEQGVELLFGEFVKQTGSGLNYWVPAPLGEVVVRNVQQVNTINIGFRGPGSVGRGTGSRDVPLESLMLTGDQNIVDIDFVVQWRIKSLADFLFNIRDPEATIKLAAESAMREVIGQTSLEDAITRNRAGVEARSSELLQGILDEYGAGVFVSQLKLQKADPPQEVIAAFNDVQSARQDKDRSVNEATAYKNDIVPRAKGEASRMIEEANAYKARVIKEAEGEAARFTSVYNAYLGNKSVTRRRLYLERMQEVLSKNDKIILDEGAGGSGVIPYLPLNELRKGQGDK